VQVENFKKGGNSMKNLLKTLPLAALGLLLTASLASAQFGTPSGTTSVSVTVGPQAGLNITNSVTGLTLSGSNYAGTTNLTYFVRTSASGGGGSISLEVTTDFSPTGGPSVGSPPTTGDSLSYTCTVNSPGTACTGPQTASTTGTTNVATFGTNIHTGASGSTASVNWTLTNDPTYKTGTYNATVTFTISAS
jgi:hypothetical protein